jgi:hypothetical protein
VKGVDDSRSGRRVVLGCNGNDELKVNRKGQKMTEKGGGRIKSPKNKK